MASQASGDKFPQSPNKILHLSQL
ncbi:unnamed protein product, partial [Rotaria magnacalcarata]